MDPPMATLTQNDGIISLMHCQEWNFEYLKRIKILFYGLRCHNPVTKIVNFKLIFGISTPENSPSRNLKKFDIPKIPQP